MCGVNRAEIERRVAEAIGLVRLDGQESKLPGQLSGGQQQRVAIARAVMIEPPLVLMDEPLSNLDATLRLEMRAEIRRIHNALGTITIYVTHDQDEALSMADRIAVLRDGSIRQVGSAKELYDSPAALEVAEFMGFRNRVTGCRLAGEAGQTLLQVGDVVLQGLAKGAIPVGSEAVAVFRPDDLAVDPSRRYGLPVQVEAIGYRGRDFVGTAVTETGLRLTFRSPEAVRSRDRIALTPDPARVLVYPASRSTT